MLGPGSAAKYAVSYDGARIVMTLLSWNLDLEALKAAADQSLKGALKQLPEADAPPPAEHGLNSQGKGQTKEFTAPHLLIHGVAGIQATTPQSIHIASGFMKLKRYWVMMKGLIWTSKFSPSKY
jgi:hypothetical protein